MAKVLAIYQKHTIAAFQAAAYEAQECKEYHA
jgi:hypothetical protein